MIEPEVFGGFWGNVGEEFHLDSTGGNSTDGYIKENDWVFRVWWPLVPLYCRVPSSRRHS